MALQRQGISECCDWNLRNTWLSFTHRARGSSAFRLDQSSRIGINKACRFASGESVDKKDKDHMSSHMKPAALATTATDAKVNSLVLSHVQNSSDPYDPMR